MNDWLNRPLGRVYPVVFVDAIVVKVRDGHVVKRPIYVAIGVTVAGERDILGLWAGDGGEGAKYWLQVLTEIKNRFYYRQQPWPSQARARLAVAEYTKAFYNRKRLHSTLGYRTPFEALTNHH